MNPSSNGSMLHHARVDIPSRAHHRDASPVVSSKEYIHTQGTGHDGSVPSVKLAQVGDKDASYDTFSQLRCQDTNASAHNTTAGQSAQITVAALS